MTCLVVLEKGKLFCLCLDSNREPSSR